MIKYDIQKEIYELAIFGPHALASNITIKEKRIWL